MNSFRVFLSVFIALSILCVYYFFHRGGIHNDKDQINDCDYMLPSNIQNLLRPALEEKLEFDQTIETPAYDSLLSSNEAVAIEARVALLAYYIGEHSGHELIESILPQHQIAEPLIKKYQECRPPLDSEWKIGTFSVSRTKYDIYNDAVKSNEG